MERHKLKLKLPPKEIGGVISETSKIDPKIIYEIIDDLGGSFFSFFFKKKIFFYETLKIHLYTFWEKTNTATKLTMITSYQNKTVTTWLSI